jgi:dihydrofolate synthase/folylpolyglutamate synthase
MRFAALDEWLAWQETLHPKFIDLGLERVRRALQALDAEYRQPFTLTVGGTNGKGSCAAMLDAILRAQGYRVGLFTSPHLLRYNERIRVQGETASDAAICESFERIDRARGETTLSYFEFGALAALDIFARSELDAQILEVGLGGRLDAVNVLDADAALIATIDLDHQEWLGHTRDAIALEKAGIFRAGKPAVCGDSDPPASLSRHVAEQGIELACLGRDFGYREDGDSWSWQGGDIRLENLPYPALKGKHQLLNAAAAIRLLTDVRARLPVNAEAIRAGLVSVRLAGRLQYLDGEVPVLLDVAHNPQSTSVLAEHLAARFPGRRVHAVFSIMRDKDMATVIDRIKPFVHDWRLAPLAMPRAAQDEELLALLRAAGAERAEAGFADAWAAFEAARDAARAGDLIVVFGSFFLVSEILARIPFVEPR